MPIVSMFFGIIVRMYYDEHNPPHVHVEYQARRALFDFHGNILAGELRSRTATRLVREWIDLHKKALENNWEAAQMGEALRDIPPLP